MKNFTDEQIVKALECCKENSDCENCRNCTGYASYGSHCLENIIEEALDLINRLKAQNKEFDEKIIMQMGLIEHQKAEIEVLKKIQQKVLSEQGSYTTNDRTVCDDCERLWLDSLLKAKSEAYKEFAEGIVKELKSSAIVYTCLINKKQTNHGFLIDDVFYCVDNTYKELTEV